MSVRTSGAQDFSIHGPQRCMEIYEATKSFVILEDFNVTGFTDDDHVHDDNAVTIRHVKLESSQEPDYPAKPLYSSWVPGKKLARAKILLQFLKKESWHRK